MVTGIAKMTKKINGPFLGSHASNKGKIPSGYKCPLGYPHTELRPNLRGSCAKL